MVSASGKSWRQTFWQALQSTSASTIIHRNMGKRSTWQSNWKSVWPIKTGPLFDHRSERHKRSCGNKTREEISGSELTNWPHDGGRHTRFGTKITIYRWRGGGVWTRRRCLNYSIFSPTMDPPLHSAGAEDGSLVIALCFVGVAAWSGWERGERMDDCLLVAKSVLCPLLSCVCTIRNNNIKAVWTAFRNAYFLP